MCTFTQYVSLLASPVYILELLLITSSLYMREIFCWSMQMVVKSYPHCPTHNVGALLFGGQVLPWVLSYADSSMLDCGWFYFTLVKFSPDCIFGVFMYITTFYILIIWGLYYPSKFVCWQYYFQVAIRNIRRDAIKAYEKLEKVCF